MKFPITVKKLFNKVNYYYCYYYIYLFLLLFIIIIITIVIVIIISLLEFWLKFSYKFKLLKDEAWFLQDKLALFTLNLKND